MSTPTQTPHGFVEFSSAISRSFVPLVVRTANPGRFAGRICSAGTRDLQLCEITATEHVVERTPELISASNQDYFKLSLMLSGSGLLIQDGREAVLRPGTLAVYDTARPYTLVFEQEFRTLVVLIEKSALHLPGAVVAQLTAVGIESDAGAAGVVVPFLGQLANQLARLTETATSRLARNAVDLIATVLSDEVTSRSVATDPHAAMLQRIMAFIDCNLAAHDLDPGSIAAAHFISVRHLHGLFQENGTTVSRWVKECRLERCRRDLLDASLGGVPVSAIAARWGFVDAAHFSRDFKVRFGVPPSECRDVQQFSRAAETAFSVA